MTILVGGPMDNVTLVGVDISKNVFDIRMENHTGHLVWRGRASRGEFLEKVLKRTCRKALIVMEACGGSNYWAWEFGKLGYEVRLIAPQHVKPYRRSQKNDRNDTEAICEAARRVGMRFVGIKNASDLDLQALHRARSRYVAEQTALINQIRGFLMERGIIIPVGVSRFGKMMPEILLKLESGTFYNLISELWTEYQQIQKRILKLTAQLKLECKKDARCTLIKEKVTGIGYITATAVLAHMGDVKTYRNGRGFSASLGMVPRQNSTGGKTVLGSITKRGDGYLRKLFVQGARAAMQHALKRKEPTSFDLWVRELHARRGDNRTVVAIANKNARKVWALLAGKSPFEPRQHQQLLKMAA